MMKNILKIASLLLPLGFASTASFAADDDRITVVELFTSQGCSSCPPADALLRTLKDQPGILPLSWPVDYWDRLGWEDTFADPHNAMRQAAYNKRFGRGGVFTPQMVFDGRYQSLGSRAPEVRDAIAQAQHTERMHIVPKLSLNGDTLVIDLPQTELSESVAVRTVWYLGDAQIEVGDGENRGRVLHYTNVVRASDIITEWDGSAQQITVPVEDGKAVGADHFALLLHEGYAYGPLVGVTDMEMPAANVGR